MELIKILKYLDKKFPEKAMASWDKSGLQIYDHHLEIETNQNIKKIFIILDLTSEALNQALLNKVDLIITRHPFLFNELSFEKNNPQKSMMIKKLFASKILIYSIHTNYDISPHNNLIPLINKAMEIKKFNRFGEEREGFNIKLKQNLTPNQFQKFWQEIFPNQHFSQSRNWSKQLIKEFYLVSGSGGDTMIKSNLANLTFVTGELKWHHWLYALDNNIQVLTLGHEMENHFVNHIASLLKNAYFDLSIITNHQKAPFSLIINPEE